MRTISAATALLAVLAVTACSAPSADPTPPPSATALDRSSAAPTRTPAETATAQPIDATQACRDYEAPLLPHPAGGDQIAAAAATAALPHGAVLNPGMQIIASVDEPGMLEAVARVCSRPLDEAELIEVANEIAVAIKADPSSDALAQLVVSGWTPDDSGTLQPGEAVTTDFHLYTWDATAAVPLSSNWE